MSEWKCGYCRETIAADQVNISIEDRKVEGASFRLLRRGFTT